MRRASRVLALALCGLACAPPAHAFSISSGFSHGCHERISLRAYADFLLDLPVSALSVPDDEIWREVAGFLGDTFGAQLDGALAADVDDVDRFLLTSFLIGVRAPDTEGHSILNLTKLRELHSDPSPEGQYAHALRGPADDGPEGNGAAVQGTRERIRALIAEAVALSRRPAAEQITLGPFYLDFYGRFDVPVHGPLFLLGQAAHAMQDSFAHMIRDEVGGYRRIVHVLNYVDAIGADHDESVDGLAHSDSMDDCTGEPGEKGGTVDAAVQATVDVLMAGRAILSGSDPSAVDALLDKWLVVQAGCELAGGFCGNQRWLDVVRLKQTEPYFEAIFGCQAGWGPPPGGGTLPLLMVLVALAGLRRYAR